MSDENTTKSRESRENNVSERYSENIEMVLFVIFLSTRLGHNNPPKLSVVKPSHKEQQ